MAQQADQFRLNFPRALGAIKKLIANKEDTEQVFIIMRSLAGRAIPNGYARLLGTPEGGRHAYRRVEMAAVLDDHEALRRLPEGTVGRAYLRFVESEQLSAKGLADESRKVGEADIDAEHPLAWYGRRLRDVHDIWHVLTGYHRDALGEASVVAFSYAQTKSLGFALIAFAGAREIKRALPDQPILKTVWEAYQHGKRAAWLPGQDYEALLAEPLESARRRLNIEPPATYRAIPIEERDQAMAPAGVLQAA
jgi:ubiquinone biosynthesis protein COQ4